MLDRTLARELLALDVVLSQYLTHPFTFGARHNPLRLLPNDPDAQAIHAILQARYDRTLRVLLTQNGEAAGA